MRLVKIFIAAAWALSAALVSAADVDPPSVAGRLNYISGPVSFAPAQASEDWVAAALNRPLTTGDRLWTDRNGRAEMHVGSLAIRMAAQTSMDVLNLEERALQLRVAQGNVNLRVRRLSSDRLLEIDTPDGAVVVRRPGIYRVDVDPSGAATMIVVRGGGQAEVFTGNSSFGVGDNEEVAISGSRQELFAAPPPDEFDRWAAGRDQHEDRIASTRYVADEMTGYEDLDQYGEWRTVSDYGAVWIPAAVPAGWAPYRYGHWVWISPWGWTWVDDAPWGFAPFHYGRWVWLDTRWAWAPGRVVARPVYSPAMVAFIGGSNFSVSVGIGSAPAIAWVPLGWREPYIPWYRASRGYVQNVNVTHVTSITANVTNITYVNRSAPAAVTVVSRENFVAARQVQQASLNVPARTLAAAPVTQGAPVAQPLRTSFARPQSGPRPPAQIATREAVAVNAPPVPVREAVREGRDDRRDARPAGSEERPRVRVINRQERVNLPVNQAPRAAVPGVQPPLQAPGAAAPAEQQRQQQPAQEQQRREQELRRQQDEQQKERQRAQQLERERQQQAAQEQQAQRQRELQRQEEQQKAQQQKAQQEREHQQQATQEQQRREQQARQQEQRQRQEEQQQRAQQQKAQAEQRQQQVLQEQRAREQQRAQQQRPEPQAAPQGERRAAPQAQEPEKGRRDRARKDQSDKD